MPKDLDNLPADHSTVEFGAAPSERPRPHLAPGDAAPSPVVDAPVPEKKSRSKRQYILGAVGLAALAAALWFGHDYWTNGRFLVSTDDAYVQADFAILAPKVTGYVAAVPAVANAHVKAGDPLVVLRDDDYRNALTLAQSQLDAEAAAIERIALQAEAGKASIAQAEAQLAAAQATQTQAASDLRRYTTLAATDVASAQKLESARAAAATADANVQQAQAGILTAQADLKVIEAQVAEAKATVAGLTASRDKAQRDLDDTVLRAPSDGVVGNLSVATGDYVTPGTRLLAVVPLGQTYIEANFKETQIEKLQPGTEVHVEVDAFPDRSFTGTVQGISPASGSVFSLLPAENATGNFTKVVQRLPVRVAVPAEVAAEGWLRPGLSVVATADPRRVDAEPTRVSANEAPAR